MNYLYEFMAYISVEYLYYKEIYVNSLLALFVSLCLPHIFLLNISVEYFYTLEFLFGIFMWNISDDYLTTLVIFKGIFQMNIYVDCIMNLINALGSIVSFTMCSRYSNIEFLYFPGR